MNDTYVTIIDDVASAPHFGAAVMSFSIYNDARSYAKWVSNNGVLSGQYEVLVWNFNGNSGSYKQGVWTDIENENYPS